MGNRKTKESEPETWHQETALTNALWMEGGLSQGIVFSKFSDPSDPSHFIWSSDKTILGINKHQGRVTI